MTDLISAHATVSGADLHRWITAITPYAANDEQVPVLQCVQLLVHPQLDGTGVLYLAATNRYALGVIRVPGITITTPDGLAGPVPPWDLTIGARELSSALAGIRRRGDRDIELAIGADRVQIRPRGRFDRTLVSAGRTYVRWDQLLRTNTDQAAPVPLMVMTPRLVGIVTRALQAAAPYDLAALRLIETSAGAPMLLATLTAPSDDLPWFTALCMARQPTSDTVGMPMWDLTELTRDLGPTTATSPAGSPRQPNQPSQPGEAGEPEIGESGEGWEAA